MLAIDPGNRAELALYAAACVLAPQVFAARTDAYELTPRPWVELALADKEAYIIRAWELLKTLAPNGPARIVEFDPPVCYWRHEPLMNPEVEE